MKLGLITAIVLSVAVSNVWASSRIVGGVSTNVESYPSVVQVEFANHDVWIQTCGGTIVNSFYIVSSAHCFSGNAFSASNRRVRAGATTRGTGGQVVTIEAVNNHPTFNSRNFDGDITVVRLASQLTLSTTVQAAVVITQGFEFPASIPVDLLGWGTTSATGTHAEELQITSVQIVDHTTCVDAYQSLTFPRNVTENMICAGLLGVGGADACTDDAGGPMFYQNILIGIISWGQGCALADFPGVSVKVSSYTDWIVSTAV